MIRTSLATLLLALTICLARADPSATNAVSLLPNGDFEKANEAGDWPAGWGHRSEGSGMTWEQEQGKRFLRLASQKPGQMLMLFRLIPLKPEIKGVNVHLRYRTADVKIGKQPWFDVRAIVEFLDAEGKSVKGGSPMVCSSKAADWVDLSRSYVVPEGAAQIKLMAGLFQVAAGQVDLAALDVTAMDGAAVETLAKENEVAHAKNDEKTAQSERKVDDHLAALLAATSNLVENGDFQKPNKAGDFAEGWGHKNEGSGFTWEEENGRHFLRLTQLKPGETKMAYRCLPLPTAAKGIEISVRYRTADVKRGTQMPGDARVIFHYLSGGRRGHMESGHTVSPDPSPISFSGKATNWTEVHERALVPEGATKLQMMPGLWFAKSGTVDLGEIALRPISDTDAAQIVAAKAAADKQRSEREAIITQEAARPALTPEVKVAGNRVVNAADGKEVWLQGLACDSMEWGPGENVLWSIHVAITQWHANVIRLAVKDSFWFGRAEGNAPAMPAEGYRATVDEAVKLCASHGVWLLLDLHRFGAPKAEHAEFWKDAAVRYKNNPAVLFELFNEPHGISWEVWRNGGSLKGKENAHTDVNVVENNEKSAGDTSVGMQALVDAVRSTGARNMVLAGGLDWSYNLSGVLKGFALNEPGGDGIMYVWHNYPWKVGWQANALDVAEKFPIIMTEVGAIRAWEDFSFIGPSERRPLEGWAEDMIGCIQKNRLNWTAFSFHPRCGPMVISDWDYTPTPYWGVYVKDALAGKTFEMKKAR